MSTHQAMDISFGDMARRLVSFYDKTIDASACAQGMIYSELRQSGKRYIRKQVIACGGMKKVSLVFDTKTGRQVAMAELRAHAPEELFEPFLREARLTALLEHPNIIAIHDIGLSADGLPFFTMDLKKGDTLAAILKKGNITLVPLLEVFIKLCDAISYAHSQKVLHLDLKPANIQIGRFGEVFICDWGLAKIAGSDESEGEAFDEMLFNPDLLNNMTLTGQMRGTPGFMAPEQIAKNGVKTERSDVYALGCILYAILTKNPPLKGSAEEICEKTLSGKIESPVKAYPQKHIPKGLNAVVMKALALKPGNRYPTVQSLRNEVKNYLSGHSTLAENAGFIKEFLLYYQRNKAVCLVTILALVVVAVTTGLSIQELQNRIVEIRKTRDLAEFRRHQAEIASERYRDELTRNMRLMGSLSGNLKIESFQLSRSLIYSDPIKAIDLSIQRLKLLAKQDGEAHVSPALGYSHFIKQDFATANEYFELDDDGYDDIYQLSKKFEKIKTDDILTVDQLAELIGDLAPLKLNRKPLMEKMLVYDHAIREDKAGYGEVVRAILEGWNRRWTQGRFEYDPAKAELLLRGNQLKTFAMFSNNTSGESPLRFLDIKLLNAQGTGLHDLGQIKSLPIQTLDIRETQVEDLSPIHHFPFLETLIVDRGQFPPNELAQLPKALKVSIR